MPVLTVLLIRHAESIVDTGEAHRLHETLDPALTDAGYRTAHEFWLALLEQQLSSGGGDDVPRKLACFSAPLMACHSTALLLSASDMPKYPDLSWRYTVAATAKVPTAVPIVVHNELASFTEDYATLDKILAAGLLHGAAAEWNNADSRKGPLAAKLDAVQSIIGGGHVDKNSGEDFLHHWKQDRSVHPPRKVLEAQFLRQTDPTHWWSLTPMTGKRNLLVDLLSPNMYLPPPRKGMVQSMLDHTAHEAARDPVQAVRDCVLAARTAGCDTVLLILPAPTIAAAVRELLLDGADESTGLDHVSPLSMTACSVTIHDRDDDDDDDDDDEDDDDDDDINNKDSPPMEWHLLDSDQQRPLPPPTPVDCTDMPPADIDPASVPANQWSVFPVPPPENIPDDYPDLPPFGLALSKPLPSSSSTTAASGPASSSTAPLGERSINNNQGPTQGSHPISSSIPQRSPATATGRGGGGRAPVVSAARGGGPARAGAAAGRGGGRGGRTGPAAATHASPTRAAAAATGQRDSGGGAGRGGGHSGAGRGLAPVAASSRGGGPGRAGHQQQPRQQSRSPMSPTPRSPGRSTAAARSPTTAGGRAPIATAGRSPSATAGRSPVRSAVTAPSGKKSAPQPPPLHSPGGRVGGGGKPRLATTTPSQSPRSPASPSAQSPRQRQHNEHSSSFSSSLSSPPLSPQSPAPESPLAPKQKLPSHRAASRKSPTSSQKLR